MLVLVPAPPCRRSTTMCRAEQAFAQLPAGPLDRVGFGGIVGPGAQRAVGHGAGQLHRPVRAGQARVHGLQGQREILQRARRMDAVQRRRRDPAASPEQIRFECEISAHRHSWSRAYTRTVDPACRSRFIQTRPVCRPALRSPDAGEICCTEGSIVSNSWSIKLLAHPARLRAWRNPADIPCSSTARWGRSGA